MKGALRGMVEASKSVVRFACLGVAGGTKTGVRRDTNHEVHPSGLSLGGLHVTLHRMRMTPPGWLGDALQLAQLFLSSLVSVFVC